MDFRIGFGYDVHQLKTGNKFILGGIQIPYEKGAVGHSDADVLIHAICDALLGAANLRDIGFHFPDTSEEYKGVDSKILLQKTIKILDKYGYITGNIDSTICLQQPKIQQFIPKMQSVLAETMNIKPNQISIKATTTENLGFVGSGDGLSVYAVALIHKRK